MTARLAIAALVVLLAAVVSVASAVAGGATKTPVETTATIDLGAQPPCERSWTSDGVDHARGCPTYGSFTAGDFAGGTLSALSNFNFNLKTLEGTGWGTVTYVTPLGTFEGSYVEKSSFDISTFVLTLEGKFVGRSEDGRKLELEWIGAGFFFGVITYAVEGTILDPPS